MKIVCNREQLLSAFQMAATVVPGRSPKPVLQNVRMDANEDGVTLTATDMELGIRVEVPRLEVSSTDLRARVQDGRPLRFLVPDAVLDLISARRLYREAA